MAHLVFKLNLFEVLTVIISYGGETRLCGILSLYTWGTLLKKEGTKLGTWENIFREWLKIITKYKF